MCFNIVDPNKKISYLKCYEVATISIIVADLSAEYCD